MTGIFDPCFTECMAYEGEVHGVTPQKPCYSGNISATRWWKYAAYSYQGYQYTYDPLNRLSEAVYYGAKKDEPHLQGFSQADNYTVSYAYDRMGNMLNLRRMGVDTRYGDRYAGYGVIDDLAMEYDGNRLMYVSEAAPTNLSYNGAFNFHQNNDDGTQYGYNLDGRMTRDMNKNLAISYDVLGHPSIIRHLDTGSVERYVYDALGRKLCVIYLTDKTSAVTPVTAPDATGIATAMEADGEADVLHRIDYIGSIIINRGKIEIHNQEGYNVFQYVQPTYNGKEAISHVYYKDHLGSNRADIAHLSNMSLKDAVNDYYPFGMSMGESSDLATSGYKYTGKKLDRTNGLDLYDFGARLYDPVVPHWLSMDPLAEKYYDVSPYVYCMNNPVNAVDPDGKEIWIYYKDDNGEMKSFQYTIGMNFDGMPSTTQTIIKNFNAMSKNTSGRDVLTSIVNSKVKYGFLQENTYSVDAEGYFDSQINTVSLADPSNTITFAEETFHVYQYVNGQYGKTAVNEVEAKLFSAKMNFEIEGWNNIVFFSAVSGISDSPYEIGMTDLLYNGYNSVSFLSAVNNFFEGKLSGSSYRNKGYVKGDIRQSPLIKSFLPLKDYK